MSGPRPDPPGQAVLVRLAGGRSHRGVVEHLLTLNPFLAEIVERFAPASSAPRDESEFTLRLDAEWLLEFFGVTDPGVRASAAMAWQMLTLHAIVQDHRLDGDFTDPADVRGTDLLSNVLIVDSLHLLAEVAGTDPAFWAAAHEAFDAYAWAYAAEPDLARYYRSPPDERMIALVADRVATVKILATALACASGRHDRVRPACVAVSHLLFAEQVRDDFADWRDDHHAGKPTYVLLRLAERVGRPLAECTDDDLADELYLRGGLEEFVAQIEERLGSAVAATAGMPSTRFFGYASAMLRESRSVAGAVAARKSAYGQHAN